MLLPPLAAQVQRRRLLRRGGYSGELFFPAKLKVMVDALVSRVAEVRRWCRDDGGAAEKMIASGTAGWFVVAAGVQWWREAAQVHGCRCAKRGGVRDGAVAGSRRCRWATRTKRCEA